jgi:hypothetical protein
MSTQRAGAKELVASPRVRGGDQLFCPETAGVLIGNGTERPRDRGRAH